MNRIPSLDGLRAISIVLVIICHFGNDLGWGDPLDLGALGVRVFFVISGFLITGLLLAELDKSGSINLSRFYFRRTLRIFPPFYFYLVIMLFISTFGWSSLTLEGALPALTYTSNYWSSKWENAGFVTSNSWSLATEEQFYLLWPMTLVLLGRRRAVCGVTAILVLLPVFRSLFYFCGSHGSVGAPHWNADHLGTGCLLSFVGPRIARSAVWHRVPWPVFAILPISILGMNSLGNHPSIHRTIVPTLINFAIAACMLWVITYNESMVGKMLNAKWVTWIGMMSYSIYLWQQPFSHLHAEHPTLLLHGAWRAISCLPVSLGLMTATACISYYCVERPSLRLRNYLESVLTTRSRRVVPAN